MSFEKQFKESKGKPIVYRGKKLMLMDRLKIFKYQAIKIQFIDVNSKWRQGLILKTKGKFTFENGIDIANRCVLWQNTAPVEINVAIFSKNEELLVYNVWDVGNGIMDFGHNGAAMYVEAQEEVRKYYCSDGYPDESLNNLIFSLNLEP